MAVDASDFEPCAGAPDVARKGSGGGIQRRVPILKWQILIAGILGLSFGYALAQSASRSPIYNPPSADAVAPARRPGHLTPNEVIAKRLLDFMGNSIGLIQAVSPDGRLAIVMPNDNTLPFTVAMSRLSIGMGSHTVIQDARGDLDPAP